MSDAAVAAAIGVEPEVEPTNPENVGVVVVIGQNYWGKGKTVQEAKAAWKKVSYNRRLKDGYTVVEFDAETEFTGVDGMGRVHWRSLDGEPPNQPTVTEHPPKG